VYDRPSDPNDRILKQQDMIEKVELVLQTLSNFEESSAAAISDMLSNFTGYNDIEGAINAHRFIAHMEVLCDSINEIDKELIKHGDQLNLGNSKELKQIVKKIIGFFAQLTKHSSSPDKMQSTKLMIQMVTRIAHVFKVLMRMVIQATLILVL
jgi:hypothetical protein